MRELTRFGDRIIMEIDTTEDSIKINDEYLKSISERCRELKEKNPKMNLIINNYLDLQKKECEVIENDIEGMIWVLKKFVN